MLSLHNPWAPYHGTLHCTQLQCSFTNFPSSFLNQACLGFAWPASLSHSHLSVLMKYGMKDRRIWRLGTFSCFFLTSSRSLRKSYWTCQWMLQRDLLVVSGTDLEILCRTALSAAAQPHVFHTTPFIDLTYSQLLFPASVPRANDYLGSRKLILP